MRLGATGEVRCDANSMKCDVFQRGKIRCSCVMLCYVVLCLVMSLMICYFCYFSYVMFSNIIMIMLCYDMLCNITLFICIDAPMTTPCYSTILEN